MTRRLFFLLPDTPHANELIQDLETAGIHRRHLHTLAGQAHAEPAAASANAMPPRDWMGRIERALWGGNLTLFVLAAIGLAVAIAGGQLVWAGVAVLVMLATFVGGTWYAQHVPSTSLAEFAESLRHDEILVMVDVPKARVGEIEDLVRQRHPEAIAGGVGWTVEALGL